MQQAPTYSCPQFAPQPQLPTGQQAMPSMHMQNQGLQRCPSGRAMPSMHAQSRGPQSQGLQHSASVQAMPSANAQNPGLQQSPSGDLSSLLQELQTKGQDLELSKDFLVRKRSNLQQQRQLLEEELQTLQNAREVDVQTAKEVDQAVAAELQKKKEEVLMLQQELKNVERQNEDLYADQRQRVTSETVELVAAQSRMQEHNAYLSRQLEQIKAEVLALKAEKDTLALAEQQPPPTAVAKSGKTDSLRVAQENRRLVDENAELRSALASGRLQLERSRRSVAEVEVTSQRVEVRIVERGTREKQMQLVEEKSRLEAELRAREAGLRELYEAKRKQVRQVEMLTVPVESSKVMRDLVDMLNAREREISQLKRQLRPSMKKL